MAVRTGTKEANARHSEEERLKFDQHVVGSQGDLFTGSPPAQPDKTDAAAPINPSGVETRKTPDIESLEYLAVQLAGRATNLGLDECYLTDKEVAKRYGIVRQTVWRRVASGHFPEPILLPPGNKRWRLSTLIAFEEKLNQLGASAEPSKVKSGSGR